jgi:hypothetical protein
MAKRQKDRQHNGQKTEGQTTQLPKEKVQKEKQRSTKHTNKTKGGPFHQSLVQIGRVVSEELIKM